MKKVNCNISLIRFSWRSTLIIYMVVGMFSCSPGTSESDAGKPLEIDFQVLETAGDYSGIVAQVLKEDNLYNVQEGQVLQLFEQVSSDSLMNEVIGLLSSSAFEESNLLFELFLRWDKHKAENDQYRLGNLIKIMLNDPQLSRENAKLIIDATDYRHQKRFRSYSTQNLIANSVTDINRLSEGASIEVKSALSRCGGILAKDNRTLNHFRKRFGLELCQ